MADFYQSGYTKDLTIAGAGRVAYTDAVLGTDPVKIANIINKTTFKFVSATWTDFGATSALGISKGDTEVDLKHNLANPVKTWRTASVVNVNVTSAETGNEEMYVLAWDLGDAAIDDITDERIRGIGAPRLATHRSLSVVHMDENGYYQAYYLRDVARKAGDVAVELNDENMQVLQMTFQAYKSTTAAAAQAFGIIFTDNHFAGVDNPP